MPHWADKYIKTRYAPFGVVRVCTVKGCRWGDFRPTGHGRGAGFREGNKQRGRALQHVKEAHPELKPLTNGSNTG